MRWRFWYRDVDLILSSDTNPESLRVLTEIYRRMSPQEKLRRVFSAYETGKALAMAGLRRLHPDASETEIWHLRARQHLGKGLYDDV